MICKSTIILLLASIYTACSQGSLGDSVFIGISGKWGTYITFEDDSGSVLKKLEQIPSDWLLSSVRNDSSYSIFIKNEDRQNIWFISFLENKVNHVQYSEYHCNFNLEQLIRLFKVKVTLMADSFSARSKDESLLLPGVDAVDMSYLYNSALYKYYITPCYDELPNLFGRKCYGITTYINKHCIKKRE